jgi:L-glutamine:2-deoxy-scyllo-inosose/3-amino-2,3-dideoxy-scyllo-inosose aminotransferase
MPKLAVNGGTPVRAEMKQWPTWPIHDEGDVRLLSEITRSNRWSYDGPYEWKFAKEFATYHGSKFGLCCANGTVGIQIALEALGIGAYDEVIVPGMTWQATAAAVADVNALPILVDIEADTWCLDLKKVEAAITRKTKAVIVVHLYGCMADMTALKALCKKKKLFLVEDCAHQHGAFWKGKGVGALGDVSSFSFQESKVLSSGEGGFNMCQDKTIFERLYSLRNCGRGWQDNMKHTLQSGNYRLTEWQAGILLGGLARLDAQVKTRDANAIYLSEKLSQIPGILPMRRRPEISQASYFNYAFRLDWNVLKAAKGVTNSHFSAALSAETNVAWNPPYEPLNACSLYKPQTKSRHKITADYFKRLDPKKFPMPIATDAHVSNGVVCHHRHLMGTRQDMDDIATAVAKIVANMGELKSSGPVAKRQKYRALVTAMGT